MSISTRPICLTIGGSDSCGGAGIQADLRVFEALNAQGCSAITALTAQNHQTIIRIEAVSLTQLDAELQAIFEVYDVAAVKTGMLLDAEHIAVISAAIQHYHQNKILVVDPVLLSSSGTDLLKAGAIHTLQQTLIKQASLLTPNLDEAAILLGRAIDDAVEDAAALAMQYACAVLLKGGHTHTDTCRDILCDQTGEISIYEHDKQTWAAQQRHGTGCRLASAITAYLAQGKELHEACELGVRYLQQQA